MVFCSSSGVVVEEDFSYCFWFGVFICSCACEWFFVLGDFDLCFCFCIFCILLRFAFGGMCRVWLLFSFSLVWLYVVFCLLFAFTGIYVRFRSPGFWFVWGGLALCSSN